MNNVHPAFRAALAPFAPKDFEVTRRADVLNEPRKYVVKPLSAKAKKLGRARVRNAAGCNALVQELRDKGFVVYDPLEFYRNAKPWIDHQNDDGFHKD